MVAAKQTNEASEVQPTQLQEEAPSAPPKNSKIARMGTSSIPRLIVEFAIPSILGMLVNGAYNLIDSIFLGNAIGEIGLATATIALPIMIVFIAIALLVGNGGNALAALRLGEGSREGAEQSLGNAVSLSIIVSIVIAIALSIPLCMDGLLTISGATSENWHYAESFIRILSFGFIFQCISLGINNYIRTAGAPNRALITMVIGAGSCTIFNYIFVMVLGMGVQGSALATVLGQGVSCVCVLWYFIFTKNVALKLRLRYMLPHRRTIALIVSLGMASFAVQAGMAITSFILNNLLNVYGATNPIGVQGAFAAIGVVQRVSTFAVLPLIGVAIAIQPLLGFNYGARLYDRVKKTLWFGILGAMGIGVVLWVLIHVFPHQIVGFFGITDESLSSFTAFALEVQLLMLPFLGLQLVGSNYFQATGQPTKSIFLSLTRQILFLIPLLFILAYVLPLWFPSFTSLDALYFATPVADFLSIFTTLLFVSAEGRRLMKLKRGVLKPATAI